MSRRTGLIDSAVATLRSKITSGEWPVGSRIPPEPALAELLGVGRNTVREAVQSLVRAGLVQRRQGSGTYVLATNELARSLGRQIADSSRRDVLEVRRALEVEAARLAARRHTPADADELARLVGARRAAWAVSDTEAMVTTDVDLHVGIARASGNAVLVNLYENLLGAVSDNIRFNVESALHMNHSHDELIVAILEGRADDAAREVDLYLAELLRSH